MPTKSAAHWITVAGYAVVALFVLYYTGVQVQFAVGRGDQLSDHARYTEAGSIRAGEGFADNGLTSNDGLPDIAYGHAFEATGAKHDRNICASPDRCVYLHNPPAQDLLLGVATDIFGKGHVARFRTVPLLIAFAGLGFMAWAMAYAIGPFRAAFVMATFAFVPMVTASMHNLTYVGYEISLLEAEIGVLLLCFFCDLRLRVGLPALFVLGFLSGWVSWDYLAHVPLCALAIWFLRGDLRKHRKLMLYCTAASAGGYYFACALHLLQVAVFLGSIQAMLDDYTQRGLARMSGSIERGVRVMGAWELVVLYTTKLVGPPNFYLGNYLWTSVVTLVALCFPTQLPPVRIRGASYAWRPAPSLKWAFLVAFVIPYFWIVLMRQHASVHVFYLPRNWIVTFIVGALALALSVQRRPLAPQVAAADPEPPPPPAPEPEPLAEGTT